MSDVSIDEPVSILEKLPPQSEYDTEVIASNIVNARRELANAKFQYAAAAAGLPGSQGHLKQHAQRIAEVLRAVDALEEMARDGLPIPTGVAAGAVIELPTLTVAGDGRP